MAVGTSGIKNISNEQVISYQILQNQEGTTSQPLPKYHDSHNQPKAKFYSIFLFSLVLVSAIFWHENIMFEITSIICYCSHPKIPIWSKQPVLGSHGNFFFSNMNELGIIILMKHMANLILVIYLLDVIECGHKSTSTLVDDSTQLLTNLRQKIQITSSI